MYIPLGMDGFELCHPISSDDFETINLLINGEPRQATWKPLAVQLIRRDQGSELRPSDSPWLGEHALIFKSSAIAALGPMLRQFGELLPLNHEEQLFMLNATRVVNALDEKNSSLVRFDNGRLMDITRYAFLPAAIEGLDIFKIPDFRVSPTFLGERFVERWRSAGLHGLEFDKVWSS